MSREVVTSLYSHKQLISLVMLDHQRQPLMRTDVRRREIWEWSDHTRVVNRRMRQISKEKTVARRVIANHARRHLSIARPLTIITHDAPSSELWRVDRLDQQNILHVRSQGNIKTKNIVCRRREDSLEAGFFSYFQLVQQTGVAV